MSRAATTALDRRDSRCSVRSAALLHVRNDKGLSHNESIFFIDHDHYAIVYLSLPRGQPMNRRNPRNNIGRTEAGPSGPAVPGRKADSITRVRGRGVASASGSRDRYPKSRLTSPSECSKGSCQKSASVTARRGAHPSDPSDTLKPSYDSLASVRYRGYRRPTLRSHLGRGGVSPPVTSPRPPFCSVTSSEPRPSWIHRPRIHLTAFSSFKLYSHSAFYARTLS